MKFIIDSLEDVAEALRGFYKQRADGKYQLDVEGAEPTDDVLGLKSALAKEKADALELKKKLEGLTKGELAELARLKKAQADADRKKLEDEGNFEAVKKQMIDAHNEEIGKREARVEKLMGTIRKLLVDNAATQAIVAAKGNPKLLSPIVKSSLNLIENGDDFSVVVVDERGQPRTVGAEGKHMSIEAYVESLKAIPDFQPAFAASGSSGGGSHGGGGGGDNNGPTGKHTSEWTLDQKNDFIVKNGLEAFRDLVAKQGVKTKAA